MKRSAAMVIVVVAACGGKKQPEKKVEPVPETVSDGAEAPSEPDENAVRAGKRTGLESPDGKPEVATEPLMRALLAGQVPWTRFVDPASGAVVLRLLSDAADVNRRCGAALDEAFAAFATSAAAVLADQALVYDVTCDNVGLAVTIPGVASHAVCTISSPAEGGIDHDLVLVPDPALGLRIIGVATADAALVDDALLDRFDEEMGRYGAKCP
jgi:hypothetical protein